MSTRSALLLAVATALSVALASCSDDDSTVVPPADTTPPGVSAVTPVDAYHIDVVFNEQVNESSAEDPSNYLVMEAGTPIRAFAAYTPGDTILIASAVRNSDKKTVTVTTYDTMDGLTCNLAVHGVADVNGNDITTPVQRLFTGSSAPDETAPEIASRSPLANATGVATNGVITVQFSEPVATHTIALSQSGTPVPVIVEQLDVTTYRAMPQQLLEFNTGYTVDVDATDAFANAMTHAEWSFTTIGNTDNTPPTLLSSTPANGAVYVNVNSNLSLTFSEAVQQNNFNVSLLPDPGEGIATWSNGGRTVTFDPAAPLLDNQQYIFTIAPGGVLDLTGNSIQGVQTRVFSTGSTLETGRVSGTVIGDPGSEAGDPTGATVLAVDNLEGTFNILAATTVAPNNSYSLSHLPDGAYFILAILPTNEDDELDPESGDAFGAYGMDPAAGDLSADSVVVAGGAQVTGIIFPLYDPSAIAGTVTYSGTYADGTYGAYVGLFHTAGFDPQNPGEPVAYGVLSWPDNPAWSIDTIDPIPMGDYYVGAYLDVNMNQSYDVGTEPVGLYGGLNSPSSIHLMYGNDIGGLVINLVDPIPGVATITVKWSKPMSPPMLQRLYEIARRGQ